MTVPEPESTSESPLRILMLEDNPADAELVTYQLRKGGLEFRSERVETEEAFKRMLTDFGPDILLLDFELPTFDGLSALLIAKSVVPDVPAIFVTGVMGEESAIDMLHQGATDYVLKDNLSRLVSAVSRALSEVEEMTKRRAAEEALITSEIALRRTQFTVDHSADSVFWLTPEAKIVYANEEACRRRGYTRDEMLSLSMMDINMDFAADPGIWEEMRDRLRESGHFTSDFRHITKDGQAFPVEVSLNRLEFEGEELFVANVRDITEREQAGREKAALERRITGILSSVREGIAAIDMNRVITWVNRSALEIIGYSEEDLVGKSMRVIYPSEEAFEQAGQRYYPAMLEKGYLIDELLIRRSDGKVIPVEATLSLMREDGRPTGIVAAVRDISDRRQLEERQAFAARLLSLLNQRTGKEDTIRHILEAVKEFTGFEAVGVRLAERDDYPYYQTNGFPAHFVEAEMHLCSQDGNGDILRDAEGHPLLECMCGNIIQGRFDPSLPFFTDDGSFWTNSTTELLASTTEADRQALTRNRCNSEGYESMALIPLRSDSRIIGLLQLNDTRKDMLDLEGIQFFEGIAASIGIAVDRKNTIEALRESKEELQQLFDKMINAFVLFESVFDESGAFVSYRFLYINEAYERITGVKNEEVRGKTVQEVWPGTEQEWIKRYGEVAVSGIAQTFELYHDPTAKLYHCNVYRPWNTSERFCVIFEDITESRIAESAARLLSDMAVRLISVDSGNMREQLEHTLEDIAVLTASDRCFLHIGSYETRVIEQAYEWRREGLKPQAEMIIGFELQPMTWLIPMLESRRTVAFSSVDDLPGEAEVERRAWTAAGIVSLLGVPLLPEGTLRGFLGISSETARRTWSDADESLLRQAGNLLSNALARTRAEEALRRSEAYYQALLEQTIDCITVLDADGTIRFESPSITPLLGYEPDELLGRNVFDYIHPEDAPAAIEAFTAGLEEPAGTSGEMEVRFRHKDGSWRRFWGVGRTMLDDPAVRGIILNSRDVTER